MADRKIIQSTVKLKPAPKLGVFSSKDYNEFHRSTVNDIGNIVEAINSISTRVEDNLSFMKAQTSFLSKRIIDLEQDIVYKRLRAARMDQMIDDWVDFHDTVRLSHPSNQPDRYKAMIDGTFGEAVLPMQAVQSKFYTQNISTGEIVIPTDLQVTTTSVFDKLDGNGLKDHEQGGSVIESNKTNAFNGVNNSVWKRRVEFPLESDVSEVEVELTVQIPDQSVSESNMLSVLPYPYGEVDIQGIYYSSDLSSSFSSIPSFTAINNARNKRFHFSPRVMSQIKIRLRQRNWFEENGKKVFLYGLEELGLYLVEWERTYIADGNINENATFITRFDAPSGYKFSEIYSFNATPDFMLENISSRHVHAVLSTTPNFNGVFWNSDINVKPQDMSSGVAAGFVSTIYCILTLNWVDSSGGSGSPYSIGTPPYLNGIGIQYMAKEA